MSKVITFQEAVALYHSKGYDECMPFYEFAYNLEIRGYVINYG